MFTLTLMVSSGAVGFGIGKGHGPTMLKVALLPFKVLLPFKEFKKW